MKNNTILFIAENAGQVREALIFKKNNTDKKVLVMTSKLEVFVILEKLRYPNDVIEYSLSLNRNFYSSKMKNIATLSRKKYEKFRGKFANIKTNYTPVYEALSILIEAEFAQAIYMKQLLRKLTTRLLPLAIFVPKELHDSSNLVKWIKLTVSSTLIHEYTVNYSFFEQSRPIDYYARALVRLSKRIYYQLRNIGCISLPKKKDGHLAYVFHSSGMNLRFYISVLQKLRHNHVLILTGEQSAEDDHLLYKAGIAFTSFSRLKFGAEEQRTKITVNSLRQKLQSLINLTLEDEFDNWLFHRACKIIDQRLVRTIKLSIKAGAMMDYFKPKILFTTHDPAPSTSPFVFEAKARGIQTIVLLHGWNDLILGENYYSHKIIVWGKSMKNWYNRILHKNNGDIFVGGFPDYDKLVKAHAFWLSNRPWKKKAHPVLGVLLTYFLVDTFLIEQFIIELLRSAKLCQFSGEIWIRTHPGQNIDGINKIASYYNVKVKYNTPSDLNEFMENCDYILSWDTSAIYAAMIYGKPLLYTTPAWGDGITPVKKYSAANFPNNAASVYTFMQNFNQQQLEIIRHGQLNLLKDLVGYSPEQTATDATVKVIRSLLLN